MVNGGQYPISFAVLVEFVALLCAFKPASHATFFYDVYDVPIFVPRMARTNMERSVLRFKQLSYIALTLSPAATVQRWVSCRGSARAVPPLGLSEGRGH